MKKFIKTIVIGLLLILSLTVNAQYRYQTITADTVQGNENIYFTPSVSQINIFDALAGFQFTVTNTAGAADVVYLQGSVNGTNYETIDNITTPTTATTYTLYDYVSNTSTLTTTTSANTSAVAYSIDTCGGVADTTTLTATDTSTTTTTFTNVYKTPIAKYKKYRLWVDGGIGDTVIFNPVIFYVKKRE